MSIEKDKNRYRNKERKVRFTEEENQYLLKKIRQSGLNNFQNYALKMLLNGQIVTIDYSELLNLRKEINKIGQNINQLTKYANTFNESADIFVKIKSSYTVSLSDESVKSYPETNRLKTSSPCTS